MASTPAAPHDAENRPGELSAESDRQAAERLRRWRRSPLGIACIVLAIAAIIGINLLRSGSGDSDILAWLGGGVMVALGIYGLTRRGAQKTAQSGRISGGYAGMPTPKTVRGARIMSGALLAAGIIALLVFATVGT